MLNKLKRELTDLQQRRTAAIDSAQAAYDKNDQDAYRAAMDDAAALSQQIAAKQRDITVLEQSVPAPAPTGAEARDIAEERGRLLLHGEAVNFSTDEIRRDVLNQVTLASGGLVEPVGAGTTIHDLPGVGVSSIIDLVTPIDLTGLASYEEPYVISETEASAGVVKTLAGTTRAASTDPKFGVAPLKPVEVNTTSFVDRNLSRLSPAAYYNKIYEMAMRALRRKVAKFIVCGDGEVAPAMYGLVNAKNKAGEAIFDTLDMSAIDVDTLDELYFAYGSEISLGGGPRLILNKKDLKALGKLRGANEKRRLFTITPDAGNPNIGIIQDGGVNLPFVLSDDVTALSASQAGEQSIQTMIYADPANYLLGLFGDYSIRVDESVKAVERMTAILGDVFVGGNLVVHKGSVVATLPQTGD